MKADVESVMGMAPGARLKKARESAHLSLSEAADSLKMSPGAVRALEADDYRSLPNATFVKGYIRSYARLLGMGSEELVRAYESLTGSDKPEPVKPIETPRTSPKGAPILIAAIVLLIVLVAVYFFWDQGGAQPQSSPPVVQEQESVIEAEETPEAVAEDASDQYLTSPAQEESGEVSPQLQITRVPEGSNNVAESVSTQSAGFIEPAEAPVSESAPPADPGESVPAPSVSGQSASEQPDAVSEPISAEGEAVPPSPKVIPFSEVSADGGGQATITPSDSDVTADSAFAANMGVLSMTFTGDCWVEVRDVNGELIYSNLKRLGETLTVEGKAPLEAKLGNGNVVALTYNGQPVTFRVPHHNVVRVRLGD